VGGWLFAATMLITVGIFQAIAGLVAIFDDDFYLETANYTFDLNDTAWGFAHLILGALLVFGGWSLISGATWAVVVALTLAVISAVANFFFIPYYPFWSIVIIAIDVWVIWSLTRTTPDRTLES
jgi:hypothetical protein